jgi:hypothetical protein
MRINPSLGVQEVEAVRAVGEEPAADLAERVAWGHGIAYRGLDGVIVFFLQIDTLPQKNSSRDKHLQNRLSETPCAFGAD